MKLFKLSLLTFCLFILTANSQAFYKNYDWDKTPNYNTKDYANDNLVALKEKITTEFFFTEDSQFVEFYLEHKTYYLNSDEAIEDYNKIYLPYDSDSELLVNKARVITPSGKVIDLDDSKILTATNDETKRTYKYFAFEGIEKGSFIEFMYVVKRSPVYKGKRISFQDEFKKKNIEFDVFAPSNLVFKFKSYNGLKEVEKDTIIETKNHWSFKLSEVEKLEEESQALYSAERQFIIYALDSNTANNTRDITSYASVAQNVYNFYNAELSKKTKNALKRLIRELKLEENADLDTKIRAIENYIKTNIFAAEFSSDKLSNLDSIIEEKVASESGLIKLYIAIFNELNIKHNMVFTCSRKFMHFDKEFEANIFLQDIIIYFPKTKKYLAPNENESRYGFPPGYLTDTYGLFIKQVKVGDFVSAVGKIKKIKPVDASHSTDNMIINVNFDSDDISTTYINLKRSMSGYYGMFIHPYIDLVKPEDKKELIEGFAKNLNEGVTINKIKMENDKSELFGIKPIVFDIDFTSDAFVEKAGKKYLFKVGELIGSQMELYQEKERVLSLENEFQRSYERTINITIPEGYTIANLDEINIDNEFEKNGKILLSFKSYYELDDNLLKITANEYYKINKIPVTIYEDYRRVINSAADFNKITLLLIKE
ncbi:DUF3857 domain-containing protein [uncultured Winogradskyella sp.]|uniref:DUF3857 domain-containing protein n=1 Tax=uncultured Winogradskyella sp. TaxID=395353 RepID=UPI0030D940FA|tara:strand:- start:7723 stop:9687 length:1965 start_codon:yes stop_codon:yes gene_type:complete